MNQGFEAEWWNKAIKDERKTIDSPDAYIQNYRKQMSVSDSAIRDDVEFLLSDIRDLAYQNYLQDEARLNANLMKKLFSSDLPVVKHQLMMTLGTLNFDSPHTSKDLIEKLIVNGIAETSGACFEYIQALSTSNTNARRSRAGKTFESLFAMALHAFGIPFQDQNSLGTKFYKSNNLGKKVDFIVPSSLQYEEQRNKCAIISTKTTLRERWQQVVEELQRSNVPHIYLATLDKDITSNVLQIMKNYNITLVAPREIKAKFPESHNLQDFQAFFQELQITFGKLDTV